MSFLKNGIISIAYSVVSAAVVFVLLNSLLGKIKSWSLNASPDSLKQKILVLEIKVWEPLTHIMKSKPLSMALNTGCCIG